MSKGWMRFAELIALWTITLCILALAGYLAWIGLMGESFATLVGMIPFCLQAIRNHGQTGVMNSMAEKLADSQPIPREKSE